MKVAIATAVQGPKVKSFARQPSSHVQDHIDIVARHEQDFLSRRSGSERLGDFVGSSIGSLTFVLLHALALAAWLLLNTAHIAHIQHFDPRPFPLLDLCVSIEAIFLASFIVMRQQRLARRSDERDHLILQILMLTEKEVTAALGMEREIARKLGLARLADREEVEALSRDTSIEEVAEGLKESAIGD